MALLYGAVFLGEALTLSSLGGLALILGGVALGTGALALGRRPARRSAGPRSEPRLRPGACALKGKLVLRIIPCGLGNQLFQYAAGLGLARTWQVPMVVDASWFSLPADKKPKPLRAYGLDAFALTAPSASPEEVSYFLDDGLLARVAGSSTSFAREGSTH